MKRLDAWLWNYGMLVSFPLCFAIWVPWFVDLHPYVTLAFTTVSTVWLPFMFRAAWLDCKCPTWGAFLDRYEN